MIIGILKEIKTAEDRVSMTPAGVEVMKGHGHTVLVEKSAGVGSGFDDKAYAAAGAEIVKTAQSHQPLPPKSTRHLIPGRIIRLNMKLGWLNSSPEEAKKALDDMLKVRAYSGNVRKYYEPVIVIY